jgi:hypothetical protein
MPMPVSRTREAQRWPGRRVGDAAPRVDGHADLAALGELHGVVARLTSTWPSRSGSPTSARRHVGGDVEQQLQALLRRP